MVLDAWGGLRLDAGLLRAKRMAKSSLWSEPNCTIVLFHYIHAY